MNAEGAFGSWLELHGKQYADNADEYSKRFQIWKANLDFIVKHNAEHTGHKLDLNEFADLTWEEFSSTRLGLIPAKDAAQR